MCCMRPAPPWPAHACDPQQEAAFLIWHHALNNEDKLTELLNNNIISACLVVLDAPESTPVDKSCCAGQ